MPKTKTSDIMTNNFRTFLLDSRQIAKHYLPFVFTLRWNQVDGIYLSYLIPKPKVRSCVYLHTVPYIWPVGFFPDFFVNLLIRTGKIVLAIRGLLDKIRAQHISGVAIFIGKFDIFKRNRTQNVLTFDHQLCYLQ